MEKSSSSLTYIDYLNQFSRWCEDDNPTDKAIILYYALLNTFNRRGWPRWAGVDTQRLMILARTSDKKVAYRARDILSEAGFIEYVSGKKGKATMYRLLGFCGKSTTESTTESTTGNATESGTESATPNKTKIKTQTLSLPDPARADSDEQYSAGSYGYDSKPYKLAAWLDRKLGERCMYYKPKSEKQLQKWAKTFDLMHQQDGIPWDPMRDVLAWSQEDCFWQDNIQSPDKFRKQFVQLEARMTKGGLHAG